MNRSSLCLQRPLLNWRPLLAFLAEQGVRKTIPHDQMHLTLATVRNEVDWTGLEPEGDELVVPAGSKSVQIFAYTIKALTFGHPRISARHEALRTLFPTMDHPILRPHVSLYKGGRMPHVCYEGELVFGPERAEPFDLSRAHGVQHASIEEQLAGVAHVPRERNGGRHGDRRRRYR